MSDIVLSPKCNPATANTPVSFLSLPSELRNEIYELVLLHQEPIIIRVDPWIHYKLQQKFTPGLFRTNKIIHGEATSLFYGQNRFDFTKTDPEEVISFLEKIGSNNAGCIQHMLIDFPEFLYLDAGDVTLDEDSVNILANIQSGCTNLRTLTTSLDSTNEMEIRLDKLDNHKVATEALDLVDARFRAIPSLQEIILDLYDEGPSDSIRTIMTSYGWTIRTTEYVEEEDWDGGFSEVDYDEYRYNEYSGEDYDYDDYDIDDDSDFWRRAAD